MIGHQIDLSLVDLGLSNLGLGSGNFMEMQQNMQRELLSNPDTLRQMMDNPLVQSLMSNPDYMRQMLTSNPQMQQLLEVKFIFNIQNTCVLP